MAASWVAGFPREKPATQLKFPILQQPFFIDSPLARERINAKGIEEILQNPHQKLYLLIGKTNQVVIGTILFENRGHFGLFTIAKEYQGQGFGHVLLNHVENTARALDKTKMKIEVFSFAGKLRKHYEKLGYSYTGKTFEFHHGDCLQEAYQIENKQYLLEMKKKI